MCKHVEMILPSLNLTAISLQRHYNLHIAKNHFPCTIYAARSRAWQTKPIVLNEQVSASHIESPFANQHPHSKDAARSTTHRQLTVGDELSADCCYVNSACLTFMRSFLLPCLSPFFVFRVVSIYLPVSHFSFSFSSNHRLHGRDCFQRCLFFSVPVCFILLCVGAIKCFFLSLSVSAPQLKLYLTHVCERMAIY